MLCTVFFFHGPIASGRSPPCLSAFAAPCFRFVPCKRSGVLCLLTTFDPLRFFVSLGRAREEICGADSTWNCSWIGRHPPPRIASVRHIDLLRDKRKRRFDF